MKIKIAPGAIVLGLLRMSSTLDVLHCAGAFKFNPLSNISPSLLENSLTGFPSFVPDWSARRRYMPLMDTPRFTAGFTGSVPIRILNQRPLVIPGLTLDTVNMRTVPYLPTSKNWPLCAANKIGHGESASLIQ